MVKVISLDQQGKIGTDFWLELERDANNKNDAFFQRRFGSIGIPEQ